MATPPEPGRKDAPATVEGTVQRVVFVGRDGLFAVARLEVLGHDAPLMVVGPLGGAQPGDLLRIEGTWERHATFGEQLRAARAVPVVPESELGVERYLSGIKGIGKELAHRLVLAFGKHAVDKLADEPDAAAKVRGMGKRRALAASKEARERRADREVLIFLQGQGISAAYAQRIRRRWGDQAIAKVRENPYRLAREVSGIGFHVADRIARGMGLDERSPLRVEAALYHALEQCADDGHVYAPATLLTERAAELVTAGLSVDGAGDRAPLAVSLESLVAQGAVIREPVSEGDDRIYLPHLHAAEVGLARRLLLLRAGADSALSLRALSAQGRATRELARLSSAQRQAVEQVLGAGVAVLTGGPGTGKTTVMKAVVAASAEAGRRVLLAAPTGRAARRLAEATGREALTVHRLLEWSGGKRGGGEGRAGADSLGSPGPVGPWGRHERNPLDADLVVVDEASMLDLPLARALASAVRPGATLLLVGDVDQLPSVGPGQVLADLIRSEVVPVARLREIFRQAAGSHIVESAYQVLAGQVPAQPLLAEGARSDFYVIPVEDAASARDRVLRLVGERIPRAFGFHSVRDVQVLTPMYRGEAGIDALNRALQDALNPPRADADPALPRAHRPPLRLGDKVIQLRNDYDRDVSNGDIGEVVAVAPEERVLTVDYDGRRVEYGGDALDDLELAYAVTVHKSQGSEYPAVVITLLPEHFLLLRRNLLYTALTRGKQLVVLVGSPYAIRRAVETVDGIDGMETGARYTRLAERLREGRQP